MKRIAIASIVQETNGLNPVLTTYDDFQQEGLFIGAEILENHHRLDGELKAAFEVFKDKSEYDLIPLMATYTNPKGPMTELGYQKLKNQLLNLFKQSAPYDGVMLALHGAMSAIETLDVEGDLIQEIRQQVGTGIPICVSLDHHANITKKMVVNANTLVGYKTEPHIDIFETGKKACEILQSTLKGEIQPTVQWRKIPMVPVGDLNAPDGPLGHYFQMGEKAEQDPAILDVSIYPEFTWSINPELGWSVVVTTNNASEKGQTIADQIAKDMWTNRDDFLKEDRISVKDAVSKALSMKEHPIIFSDSGDACTGGATGDSTTILKELMGKKIPLKAMVFVVDEECAQLAHKAGGGKIDLVNGETLNVSARVKSLSDGHYYAKSEVMEGHLFMGLAAALEIDDVYVVVAERPTLTFSPFVFRALGLEPLSAKIVVAKSPFIYKETYKDIAQAFILVDVPGVCTSNLKSIANSFKFPPRPLYPIDDDTTFDI